MKKIIAGLLIWTQIAVAGKLQDADFKTEAELISAGATAAQLLNDSKIYVTANGINKKLSTAITAGDIGGGGSGKSYLTNSNFENATVATGWTVTNSTATAETTEIIEGSQSIKLALSAQTGDLLVQSVTPSIKTTGQNFEASCRIKTTLATIQLCGMVNGVESQCVSVASNGTFVKPVVNITPSDGVSFGVKVKATSSSTGNVFVDECYAGQARNIGSVSQAVLIGQVTFSGCAAAWSTTSSTFADFATQTGCTYTAYGSASAPATNIPAIKFSSLPAGVYSLEYEGTMGNTVSGITSRFQFWDGTNTAREVSSISVQAANGFHNGLKQTIEYTTPQSNITISLRGASDATGTTRVYGSGSDVRTIRVYYFPSSSQQAVTPEQQKSPTIQKFTSGSGTYTKPSGVVYLKVKMVGGGGGGGGVGSSGGSSGGTGGDTTFGTSLLTCTGGTGGGSQASSGGGSGGSATLNLPAIGISFSGGTGQGTLRGTTAFAGGGGGASPFGGAGLGTSVSAGSFQLGSSAIPNTGSGGSGASTSGTVSGTGGGGAGGYIEAIINNPSNTYSYSVGAAGAAGTAGVGGQAGGVGGSGVIIVEEYYSQNAPILVGSVTSGTLGSERIERARIRNTGSSCVIDYQSGNWITTATRNGAGRCDLVFSAFSSEPNCISTNEGTGDRSSSHNQPTSTAMSIFMTTSGTLADGSVSLICMGAR
jgi:hypothetical protein